MTVERDATPLTPEERHTIAAIFDELAPHAMEIVDRALGAPSDSSASRGFQLSPENLTSRYGQPLYQSACDSIAVSMLAAGDNLNTFMRCIETEGLSVAVAGVTRAALECLGRAYFLLRADSVLDFYRRYLSLAYEELKYPVKHGRMADAGGQEMDGSAFRAELLSMATELGVMPLIRIELSALVADVLKVVGDDMVTPAIYSQLSGVAHGTTSAVAMFIDRTPSGSRLILPRDITGEYVGYLFAAILAVVRRVIEVFDPSATAVAQWQAVYERASSKLSLL